MPSLPRRIPPRPIQPTPAPEPEETEQPASGAPSDDATPDYLDFGESSQEKINNEIARMNRPRVNEFFITKKELKATPDCKVVVPVHFMVNYADPKNFCSVPRVTIPAPNGTYRSFTSPGNDCAIAAAGVPVSVRPLFIIADHRQFSDRKGNIHKDEVKFWFPSPTMVGLVNDAIDRLAENLGVARANVDITKYPATITKIGLGRQSTWAVDFKVRAAPPSQESLTEFGKIFEKGFRVTLSSLLAPDPRYMISKGGRYVKPATTTSAGQGEDEPPF